MVFMAYFKAETTASIRRKNAVGFVLKAQVASKLRFEFRLFEVFLSFKNFTGFVKRLRLFTNFTGIRNKVLLKSLKEAEA